MPEPTAGAGATITGSTESGGAPPQESFGFDKEDALLESSYEGDDSADAEDQAVDDAAAGKPPAKPRELQSGKVARVLPDTADILPPDPEVSHLLREARLPAIKGETREQSLSRLATHFAGRAKGHWAEIKELRDGQNRLQQSLEPLLRTFYSNVIAKEKEEYLSTIPDKESDPEGYRTWVGEEALRRLAAREESERTYMEQAAQARQREAEVEAILEIDESAVDELEEAVNSDPEIKSAFEFVTEIAMYNAETRFPDKTPEERRMAVQAAQLQDLRWMKQNGVPVGEAIKAAMNRTKEILARQSGQPAPAPAPAPAPGKPRSATADRVAREQARSRVAAAPAASAPLGTGDLDLRSLSEDEFVDAALDGRITDELIMKTFGKSSRY